MGMKTTVAGVALAMGVSAAQAADIEPVIPAPSWYVSLFGGVSWLEDVQTPYGHAGEEPNYDIDTASDPGFIVGGAVGTHLAEAVRVEFEVAYSENDVDTLRYSGPFNDGTNYDGSGSFAILTFMGNLWYDMPLGETVYPYVGGGAGIAVVDADDVIYDDPAATGAVYDSSEVVFAFQLGAGLRWKAFENVTFDVGYRLRAMDGPTFETSDDNTTDYEADWIWSHNVVGGVSVGF
ncbi:MAG: outer membrane protein [Parvibaculaceae bacterium]